MAAIVWDRDDVLNDLMRCWLEQWWNPEHPESELRYEDLTENPPHRVLGVSQEEYLLSLDEFRLSDCAAEMKPIPEVLAWFKRYGHLHRHIVLTATTLDAVPAASAWTFRHFGVWIRSFHFIPALRYNQPIPRRDADKGAYLRWLAKGDVLVDDSPSNLELVRERGIDGLLVPRPWNGNNGTVVHAMERLTNLVNI